MEALTPSGKAVIVVDLQKDNVGRFCQPIIPNVKLLLQEARRRGILVVFACDSRYPDDFIFKSGHPLRTIRGTEGVKVIDDLEPAATDIVVEKRMLSAFFGTDLDFTLRQKAVKTLIVAGVATWACVLKTVFDAAEMGYEVIVPADCCASPVPEGHESALKVMGLLRVVKPSVREVIEAL
ncbi:MAG: isochorismatase family cysteine hydrolase [Dehalococcoidia bacterium]|nr:isochorismatase family cysteine hydrolase [Dehalococcoidia bacterium]